MALPLNPDKPLEHQHIHASKHSIPSANCCKPIQSHLHSVGATVADAELVYSRCHLLGLPVETRYIIWDTMTCVIIEHSPTTYSQAPKDDFKGLILSCRQIYSELRKHWHRFIVPWPRIRKMLDTQLNRTIIRNYKSLTVELSLAAHPDYFTGFAAVLHKAQPHLRDLRIYFFGIDRYGRQLSTYGCGTLDREILKPKLPIDGQLRTALLPLWKRIAALGRLELLVISNPNFQVFEPMVLSNKPHLEYLYLPTDPRSTIHRQHEIRNLGFLLTAIPLKDQYPPVKVLHIAANASLASNSLAAKVAQNLEHLTWVVPDPCMQSGSINMRWYEQSGELLLALRLRSINLQTLRICISGAGIYEDRQYGLLQGSLKHHLPCLIALKHFEIHAKSKSYWLGKELVARLPDSLEDLYITDRTLHPNDLLHQVWERYLTAATGCPDNSIRDVSFLKTSYDQSYEDSQPDETASDLPLHEDKGPWYISSGVHASYDNSHFTSRNRDIPLQTHSRISGRCICRHKSVPDRILQPGFFDAPGFIKSYRDSDLRARIVGEDLLRHDYIPFHTGHLRFVHYEYDAEFLSDDDNDNDLLPPTLFTALLVNGRLLDKERNRHLACYDGGRSIPPTCQTQNANCMQDSDSETAVRSKSLSYEILLHGLHEIETTHPRSIEENMAELKDCSELKNQNQYFGHEDEAVKVFGNEKVAKANELPAYRYPVEKAVPVDGKCHWMSREAIIPSMVERDQAKACL